MESILQFVQANKAYFDAAHAASSIVNLIGWFVGFILLMVAWRRGSIRSVTVGPVNFQMQEAIEATAAAARNWGSKTPGQKLDVAKIRSTVARAFQPEVMDELVGRSILWVDDNPHNNELIVRALRKLQIEVEQVTTTEAGMSMLGARKFDAIISDIGRGDNLRAGYDLLEQVRLRDKSIPFLVFAGSDTPEFRAEAQKRGAQLSTNDMIELFDTIVSLFGKH